ncbi:MAG TPA: DUF5668 domain-containing protein [Azonexus sp.]
MKGNFAAVVLILTGAIALAVNLDLLDFDLVALLRTWWPLLPIGLGIALFLTPGEGGRTPR